MNAWPEPRRGGGVLATALARAEAWLLEPPEPTAAGPAPGPPARPVVAVRGLARGCGASAVARALAVVLAREDPSGASAIGGCAGGGGPRLATPPRRGLRAPWPTWAARVRTSGRVCLVPEGEPLAAVVARRACTVVIDVGHSSPPGEALGLADHVVLVASPDVERSLAAAVETSLLRAGHTVDLVLSRVEDVHAAAGQVPARSSSASRGSRRRSRSRAASRAGHSRRRSPTWRSAAGPGRGHEAPAPCRARPGGHPPARSHRRADRLRPRAGVARPGSRRAGTRAAGRRSGGRVGGARDARRLSAAIRAALPAARRAQPSPPRPRHLPCARPVDSGRRRAPQRPRGPARRRPLPGLGQLRADPHSGRRPSDGRDPDLGRPPRPPARARPRACRGGAVGHGRSAPSRSPGATASTRGRSRIARASR